MFIVCLDKQLSLICFMLYLFQLLKPEIQGVKVQKLHANQLK